MKSLSAAALAAILPAAAFAADTGLPPAQQALFDTERAFVRLAAERGFRDSFYAYFADDGIAACFPMLGDRWRVVASAPADVAGGAEPTVEGLEKSVTERAGRAAKMSDAAWISAFKIHCRQVDRYRKGGVFLAGDAAHIHSPAGGQGMNTGIQDAHNLAWKLAAVLKGWAAPALLDTYDAERRPWGQFVTDEALNSAISMGRGQQLDDAPGNKPQLARPEFHSELGIIFGAVASRLITGTHTLHRAAEQRLARFVHAPAALYFGSGYAANVGTLQALLTRDDLVVSDALNHASLIDGARLSRARIAIWAGDQAAVERYGRLTAEQFRHGRGSTLGARYERLMEEARGAGVLVLPELSPFETCRTISPSGPAAASTSGPTGPSAVGSSAPPSSRKTSTTASV